jgi:hypothetical protein
MKTTKCNKISWQGYALGISQAAIVSGETTQTTTAGDISVAVTVDGQETTISIIWPLDRWVGISFGTNGTAHDSGYMIVSSLDGVFYEANATSKTAPVVQGGTNPGTQDLNFVSFDDTGLLTELVLTRASITDDSDPLVSLDFPFLDIEQTIQLQWALGSLGDPTSEKHAIKGTFLNPLILTAVPVPAALPLLASGLFALGLFTRRKKAA